ncbi:CU044_5270 family protein [Embleya sp. NBC_00888]|uniref:CU044_5270 family protein n=1 Tax=Embleya sp. NBC_00888 TaxID=2975960 RepID=UPI003866DA66|nr:CU044_5270 family protein [Embleya sp. NBC_00888]
MKSDRTEHIDQGPLRAPVVADLTDERHRQLRTHFLHHLGEVANPVASPRPSARRRFGYVLAPLVAAAVLVGAGVVSQGFDHDRRTTPVAAPPLIVPVLPGSRSEAAAVLEDLAVAAGREATKPPGVGRFAYAATSGFRYRTEHHGNGVQTASYRVPVDEQSWSSTDGSTPDVLWERVQQTEHGRLELMKSTVEAAGPSVPGYGTSRYAWLAALPTDPTRLLEVVRPLAADGVPLFHHLMNLVVTGLTPPAQRAALYRVIAGLDGVSVVDDAVDAKGRHGVALLFEDPGSVYRVEWIFDRDTFRYLGMRTIQTRDADGIVAGTVLVSTTIDRQGLVNRVGDVPKATSGPLT